jgi:F0F1-type ATP synthase assembly protein I
MVLAATTVDSLVRFVATNPFFVVLLLVIVGLVFFLYFLVRRALLSARQGYEEGARRR